MSGLEATPQEGSGLEATPQEGSGLEAEPQSGSGLEAEPQSGTPRPHRGRLLAPDPVLRHERRGRMGGGWLERFGYMLLALVIAAVLVLAINVAVIFALQYAAGLRGESALFDAAVTLENIAPGNPYTFIVLALVGVGFAVPCLVISKWYRGQWWNALTYDAPFRWYNFVKAATAYSLLLLTGVAYGLWTTPELYRVTSILTDPPPAYAIWFGVGLVTIFIQSFGEEIFFRGLLPRILGAVLPLRLIAVGAVMLFFVSLHAANPDVAIDLKFILILFFVMEILYFTVLFRTRSIAATWGIHWVNNAFIFLLVSTEPGRTSSMVPFVYTDPVWSKGASYLMNPVIYLEFGAGLALLCVLLFWKHSPFYLPWHDEPQ